MARITKRQIKQDRLLSTTDKLSVFLSGHWKQIVKVAAAIVVVTGALVLYFAYTTSKNEEAARILSQARVLFTEAESAMEEDGEIDSAKYEEAKAKFQEAFQKGGHRHTNSEASFYLAKCSYQLGNYEEAISAFQKVVSKYPKSMFALHARKGIGQCYEQLGGDENLRKAIQQYDQLSRYPETYITLKAFIDKGRCYENLQEWDEAIAAYKNITDKFKQKVELAIQDEARSLVRKAKDVLSKFEAVLGKNQSNSDFRTFLNKASEYEKSGQERWFEALKMYDMAIATRKEFWNEQKIPGERGRMLQDALDNLRNYEELSANVIRNISNGREFEEQGDWDNALRFYRRAVQFDFLPGTDLFEEAQLRIDWINSARKA